MAAKPNLSQEIRGCHDRIRSLLATVASQTVKEKQVKEAYRNLRREITVLSLFEEETLYRRLANRAQGAMLIRPLKVQQARLDTLIHRVDDCSMRGNAWWSHLLELGEALIEYMQYKENNLLPLVQGEVIRVPIHHLQVG